MSDAGSLSFYVHAHQDDWLFFTGERLYDDLTDRHTFVVTICLTAGDAGVTDGWWEAREAGALAAVCQPQGHKEIVVDRRTFHGHAIQCYPVGKSVNYFLRLPDGGAGDADSGGGKGFPAFHGQSLAQLREREKAMTTVDGSTTYTSWRDLTETLLAIVRFEKNNLTARDISVSDFDPARNPGDHSDHHLTSLAIESAAKVEKIDRLLYLTYCTAGKDANLTGAVLAHKKAMFEAYRDEVSRKGLHSLGLQGTSFDGEWEGWGAKYYARTLKAPS